MNINRRFFLGGAISLIAATIFKPSIAGNMPTIYGDGVTDDSGGLWALLNNEPVLFNKDQIGVDKHEGITFHKGRFVIKRTIEIPKETKILVESPTFIGTELNQEPFFLCNDFSGHQFDRNSIFEVRPSHKSKLIDYRKSVFKEYDKGCSSFKFKNWY